MPVRYSKFIEMFLIPALEEKTFGLKLYWKSPKVVFRLFWRRVNQTTVDEAEVFIAWATFQDSTHQPDPPKDKRNFRALLHKLKTKLHELPCADKNYREFEITSVGATQCNARREVPLPVIRVNCFSVITLITGGVPEQADPSPGSLQVQDAAAHDRFCILTLQNSGTTTPPAPGSLFQSKEGASPVDDRFRKPMLQNSGTTTPPAPGSLFQSKEGSSPVDDRFCIPMLQNSGAMTPPAPGSLFQSKEDASPVDKCFMPMLQDSGQSATPAPGPHQPKYPMEETSNSEGGSAAFNLLSPGLSQVVRDITEEEAIHELEKPFGSSTSLWPDVNLLHKEGDFSMEDTPYIPEKRTPPILCLFEVEENGFPSENTVVFPEVSGNSPTPATRRSQLDPNRFSHKDPSCIPQGQEKGSGGCTSMTTEPIRTTKERVSNCMELDTPNEAFNSNCGISSNMNALIDECIYEDEELLLSAALKLAKSMESKAAGVRPQSCSASPCLESWKACSPA